MLHLPLLACWFIRTWASTSQSQHQLQRSRLQDGHPLPDPAILILILQRVHSVCHAFCIVRCRLLRSWAAARQRLLQTRRDDLNGYRSSAPAAVRLTTTRPPHRSFQTPLVLCLCVTVSRRNRGRCVESRCSFEQTRPAIRRDCEISNTATARIAASDALGLGEKVHKQQSQRVSCLSRPMLLQVRLNLSYARRGTVLGRRLLSRACFPPICGSGKASQSFRFDCSLKLS